MGRQIAVQRGEEPFGAGVRPDRRVGLIRNLFEKLLREPAGQLVPGVQTGCLSGPALPLPKPVATPITVTIGGQPATPITYAGEAPTLVCGVIQIDATVPTNIGSGPQTIVVTIGSNTNAQQNVTVAVQ